MQAYQIKEGIYWVGAIDWKIRNFHGYSTDKGSTYNAYLIIDEKITLVDNVKEAFTEELLSRISSVIDPAKIDYIISNHAEPDHSGSLPAVLRVAKNAKIFTGEPNGARILKAHYGEGLPVYTVKTGDSLSLGKRTLSFVQTPMVHWPDNMVSYLAEEKILFSNDAFGQHCATSFRMDYENNVNMILHEAKKYYANIVLPYGAQVQKALDIVTNLEIDVIATSHGIIWKKHIAEIMALYKSLCTAVHREKAVVVYDTMWGSTEKMARAIGEGFLQAGIGVQYMDLQNNHISDIITEIADSGFLAVGSPTLNNNMLPSVAGFLCYLNGLAPKGLKYLAFGSYGWGGQSIGMVENNLAAMNFAQLAPPIKQMFRPTEEDLVKITKTVFENLKNR